MRVLLIESFQPIIRALKLGLEEEGYTLDVARDIPEGYALAWQGDYDVIILDLALAGQSGFTLLRGWRRGGLTTHVLALTAPGGHADRVRSLDLGADDCLTKPFEFEELLARLRALARRKPPPTHDPVLRVGDLEINTDQRTVKRSGRSIYLTPREFSLLEFLARHRGQVVSRSMIWENLYNDHVRSTSNVVDVYIRYLRNKIDRGFPSSLIRTRWGEGYVLANSAG
jgi:DNA-binding response OmpR family regulator